MSRWASNVLGDFSLMELMFHKNRNIMIVISITTRCRPVFEGRSKMGFRVWPTHLSFSSTVAARTPAKKGHWPSQDTSKKGH